MFKKLTVTMSGIFITLIIATLCLILVSGSAHGTETESYLIKAYNGKISVFKDGETEPYLSFDVYISTLPEFDQIELQTGIQCDNTEELNKRIEDYIS